LRREPIRRREPDLRSDYGLSAGYRCRRSKALSILSRDGENL
jgi:hypothetical protein